MGKFKVGDKVRLCGESKRLVERWPELSGDLLIVKVTHGKYFFEGVDEGWMVHRFELVEEKPVTTLDFTKPITTRDGRKVRVLCTDRKTSNRLCVVGLYTNSEDKNEYMSFWTLDGKAFNNVESQSDLINPPVKKYINLFQKDVSKMYYDTREEAEKAGNGSKLAGYIKTVEVEL